MTQDWFVRKDGHVLGPFAGGQLKQLTASGMIRPSSELRQGTDGPWIVATKVRGLVFGGPKEVATSPTAEALGEFYPPPPPLPKQSSPESVIPPPPPLPQQKGPSPEDLVNQLTNFPDRDSQQRSEPIKRRNFFTGFHPGIIVAVLMALSIGKLVEYIEKRVKSNPNRRQ